MENDLIRLEKVTKRFGGVNALNNVSFTISKGEVHAVVGENGAGKSTLMKILAGNYTPDSGAIYLNGEPVKINDPLEARRLGVSIVYQELNLFPHLTATGNIFINREPVKLGLMDEREMEAETQRVFEQMGVTIDPCAKVGKLTVGERQQVEIARTLQQQSQIIIMDEPNSALTLHETERLFEIICRLKDQGITIIYVSHRLEEVFTIADRITVMRDGGYQGTWKTKETTIPRIVEQMIGRRLEEAFPSRPEVPEAAPVLLEVRDLSVGKTGPISFQVRAGEILGFAGLEGAGVMDVFRVMFGLDSPAGGEVIYQHKKQVVRNPSEAIKIGWGLIPVSRREQGLMLEWSIRKNATLVILDKLLNKIGLIDKPREAHTAQDYVKQLNIATDSLDKKVINLSGGNQQKVVVAKWLATGPKVLILADPTRGVDVGAKAEIYRLCDQLARQGLALLFTSSEVEEIVGLCDRTLAFYKGKILKEFQHSEATKAKVMQVIASGATDLEEQPSSEDLSGEFS
jgi:ribose transport system ATP-binding protein